MVKRLTLIFFVFCTISAAAQIVNDSTYNAIANWKRGEIVHYIAGFSGVKIIGQDTIPDCLKTYDISVRVMQKKEDYILLEWLESNYKVYIDRTDGLLPKYYIYVPTTRYIIRTDATGAFLGLDNWQQVAKNNNRVAERLRKYFKKKSNADLASSVADGIIDYSKTEQGIITNELSFITTHFCAPFGYQYQLGQKNIITSQIDANGDSISSENIIWLENIDAPRGLVQIKSMQFYDPQQATNLIYTKLATDSIDFTREEMPTASMIETHDEILHTSGWPIHSQHTYRVDYLNIVGEETSYLKLKTNLNK